MPIRYPSSDLIFEINDNTDIDVPKIIDKTKTYFIDFSIFSLLLEKKEKKKNNTKLERLICVVNVEKLEFNVSVNRKYKNKQIKESGIIESLNCLYTPDRKKRIIATPTITYEYIISLLA
ncbi:MAG: hypothetical protein PUC01_04610 [Spirochaetales bacterium]|nr:hypothetical protein [Spirochaetales bacterium]